MILVIINDLINLLPNYYQVLLPVAAGDPAKVVSDAAAQNHRGARVRQNLGVSRCQGLLSK